MEFVKNSTITLVTRVFVFICAIIISIYVARFFGPEAKGAYSLLTQTSSIVILIAMLGIDNAVVYGLSQGGDLAKVYSNILSYTVLVGLAMMSALFLSIKPLEAVLLKNIDPSLIIITIVSIPFMLFTKLSISVILGLNNIPQFNLFKIVTSVFGLISFLVTVIILKWGIMGAIVSIFFTELFMSAAYLYIISKKIRINFSFDTRFIKKLFDYGIRGFLGSLLLLVIFKIDYYVLNIFSSIRDVGLYSISVGLGEMIFFIPEALSVMLFPQLSGLSHEDRNKKTVQLLRFFIIVLGIAAIFMYLFSNKIILLIYGAQYASSIPLLRIMLPGFFFMAFYFFYFSYFYSKGKPGAVTAILFVTAVIKIALSLILIPRFGAQGASFSTLTTYSVSGFIFIFVFLRHSGESLKTAFLITSEDLRYILSHLPGRKR